MIEIASECARDSVSALNSSRSLSKAEKNGGKITLDCYNLSQLL